MSQVIVGAMIALEGARKSLLLHGRGFARIIANNVSPEASEAYRQAVEDAHDVLEHFNTDGSLKAGADTATVLASIATAMDQAMELLRPRDLELLRQATGDRPSLAATAAEALKGVPGVEAAFLDGRSIYAVAREHGTVDRQALVDIEDRLAELGNIEIHVRAHQGHGLESLGWVAGLKRIL